jgi:putative ABC transport system substrate-binding protein
MDRRTFLAGTGTVLLAAPLAAEQRGRVATVGELVNNPLLQETLRRGLREVGYVERRNIVFESRSPSSRLPDLAAELVRFPVDVIVVDTTPALQAVREVTRTMPIVMVGFGDPVAEGFVASLARPGGNITGLSWLTPEVAGKRLELLHEVLPKLTRVAVLLDPNDTVAVVERSAIETAAHATGVTIETFEARDPATLTAVFAAIKKARAEALVVVYSARTAGQLWQIVNLATANRLPLVSEQRGFADAGGLITYGPRLLDLYKGAARYVDKILKGAKPADLPVEQPTKFELVINLKTAKTLGLTIPPSLLARADEIIQ